ncbi:MAG: UDP-2,3-diacylglucosamine diphosphatase [Gammaproteobacteria bacterium]|nr:UDP-2,3-diacylglucosamine diphosphatase [Gammaproteobacteria bacterium]
MSLMFISDLHLDAKQPEIGEQFMHFLQSQAPAADALYILGDLFESWVGDDDPQPEKERVVRAIRQLADDGLPCYFMRGNRDFLVGQEFATAAGLELLADEVVIQINGEPVLLVHGDSLCTDDTEYQAFRSMVRSPAWQEQFLAAPLEERLALAVEARKRSAAHNSTADDAIMDVNQQAVESLMRENNVLTLLHGHTHRPAIHRFNLDEQPATRIVLGDWYEQGSVVTWDKNGPDLQSLPRAPAL